MGEETRHAPQADVQSKSAQKGEGTPQAEAPQGKRTITRRDLCFGIGGAGVLLALGGLTIESEAPRWCVRREGKTNTG